MSTYRFRFIKDDAAVFQAERDFADNVSALEAAEKLSADFEIEVWSDDQLLAHFRKITTH